VAWVGGADATSAVRAARFSTSASYSFRTVAGLAVQHAERVERRRLARCVDVALDLGQLAGEPF
jgi:hypothetical protein